MNNKTKLIKLSDTHYIVVDDSEIKEGDWTLHILAFNNYKIIQCKSKQSVRIANFENSGILKITHSTEPLEMRKVNSLGSEFDFVKIKPLSLSEVEELINGYSVETLYKEPEINEDSKASVAFGDGYYYGFEDGFNANKELVKDKMFTIKDMRKVAQAAFTIKSNNETLIDDFDKWFNKRIQSLFPKTEWDVEFVDGKIKLV